MARVVDMESQVMPPSGLPQDQNEWEDLGGRNYPKTQASFCGVFSQPQ